VGPGRPCGFLVVGPPWSRRPVPRCTLKFSPRGAHCLRHRELPRPSIRERYPRHGSSPRPKSRRSHPASWRAGPLCPFLEAESRRNSTGTRRSAQSQVPAGTQQVTAYHRHCDRSSGHVGFFFNDLHLLVTCAEHDSHHVLFSRRSPRARACVLPRLTRRSGPEIAQELVLDVANPPRGRPSTAISPLTSPLKPMASSSAARVQLFRPASIPCSRDSSSTLGRRPKSLRTADAAIAPKGVATSNFRFGTSFADRDYRPVTTGGAFNSCRQRPTSAVAATV